MGNKKQNKISKGFDHIGINVKNFKVSGPFYDRLLKYLGFKRVTTEKDCWGWSNGPNGLWVGTVSKKHRKNIFHRKNIGVNHIAFRATSRKAVSEFYRDFLLRNKIPILYREPKEYPQYQPGYYAVFFEDPDRIKLELMWLPK